MSRADVSPTTVAATVLESAAGRFRGTHAWRRRLVYLAGYTAIFAAIALIGFAAFWHSGRTLVWAKDGVTQHILGLEYYREYLRTIVGSVFSGHPHVPMYDFSIGMGDNVVTGLFSVAYLDIINVFVILVPKGGVEAFYVAAIIIRLYLSGLTFAVFGRYLRARPWIILVSSLVYVFSGFATFSDPRHPFFAIPMVYAPLMFLGLDLVLRRKNPFVLIGATFMMALTGYYFLYMITIVMVIYAVVRIGYLRGWHHPREFLVLAGRAAGSYLIGLAMAGFVFLPVIKSFLNSGRGGAQALTASLFLPDVSDLAHDAVFSITPSPTWNYLGLSGVVLLALCILLTSKIPRRKRLYIVVFGVILAAIYVLPIGGMVMNGFGYVSQRWTFLLAFFASALLMYVMPQMLEFRSWRYIAACAVSLYVYAILVGASEAEMAVRTRHIAMLSTAMLALMLGGLVLVHRAQRAGRPRAARGFTALFAALICASVLANVVLVYSPYGYHYAGAFEKRGQAAKLYARATAPGLALTNVDQSMYRVDDTSAKLPNAAMLGPYNGVSSYWSQSNGNYLNGFRQLELAPMNLSFQVKGLNSRAPLEALASVKYKTRTNAQPVLAPSYVATESVPGPVAGKSVLMNEDALPMGYLYPESIPAGQWNSLSALDKQEAMLQAAAIEAGGATTTPDRLSFSSTKVPYTIAYKNATWENGRLNAHKSNAEIRLSFTAPANSETYVRLSGFNKTGGSQVAIRIRSEGGSQSISYFGDKNSYYYPRPGVLANLGYLKGERHGARLTIGTKGKYTLQGIEVYSYPVAKLSSQVEALRRQSLQDVTFKDNVLAGRIDAKAPGVLVLAMPFDDGWSATVDGHGVQTFRANGIFTGLKLEPGTHQVRLSFKTPWLNLGIASTVLGVLALAAVILTWRKRKRLDTLG